MQWCCVLILPCEMRDIATLGDGNAHWVLTAGVDVITVKITAQPSRFQTHNRIGLLVKCLVTPKDGLSNGHTFQSVTAPGQSLVNDELQHGPSARAGAKRCALQHQLQLCLHVLRRGRGPRQFNGILSGLDLRLLEFHGC